MRGHVFEDFGQAPPARPAHQALQARAHERQRARRVGVTQAAPVFAPAGVALPVPALARPVPANDPRQPLRPRLRPREARHEVARRALLFPVFFARGVIARLDQLPRLREVARFAVGEGGAQRAFFDAAVPGVGGAKRGGAWANWFCAWRCKVGWLARTWNT